MVATPAAPVVAGGAPRVLTAIDARMNEVYFAAWARDASGLPQRVGEASVAAPVDVGAHTGEWHAAGSGWQAYRTELEAATGATLKQVDGAALPQARDALALALPQLAAGNSISAAALVPEYLRNKVALTLREQRAHKAGVGDR